MNTWVEDYAEMSEIVRGMKELGYQAKSSSIMDRGDHPAITVYGADKELVFKDLEELGYLPLNPVRAMKLKNGTRGIKCSLRRA